MRLSKAIPRLRFERRRLYAQSKVCPPEIGAVLGYIKRNRKEKQHD